MTTSKSSKHHNEKNCLTLPLFVLFLNWFVTFWSVPQIYRSCIDRSCMTQKTKTLSKTCSYCLVELFKKFQNCLRANNTSKPQTYLRQYSSDLITSVILRPIFISNTQTNSHQLFSDIFTLVVSRPNSTRNPQNYLYQ